MFFKKEKKNYLIEFKWNYGCYEDKRTIQAKNKNEAISKVLKNFNNDFYDVLRWSLCFVW